MKYRQIISVTLSLLMVLGCAPVSHVPDNAVSELTASPALDATFEATPMPAEDSPSPSPTPEPTLEPTATPDPTPEPTPVPTPFGIVWVSDTQHYAYYEPDKLTLLGQWILSHRETDHLVAFIHTGDIVDNGYKQWQWDNFNCCLDQVRQDMLFFPVAGNHDLGVNVLGYGGYLKQSFLNEFSDAEKYQGGKMQYRILQAGGTEILLLGIGWNMGKAKEEKLWIDQVLTQYRDIPCIVVTHAYRISPDKLLGYAAYLESEIVSKYSNIRMVLCGHVHRGFFTAVHEYDDTGDEKPDRKVYTLMLDDQDNGLLYRVLSFDPITRSLSVKTYALESDDPIPDNQYGPADFVLENVF